MSHRFYGGRCDELRNPLRGEVSTVHKHMSHSCRGRALVLTSTDVCTNVLYARTSQGRGRGEKQEQADRSTTASLPSIS